jgi:hypothetical protein
MKSAPRRFLEEWQEEIDAFGCTTRLLEKLEFYEGIKVDGPVEVRSAWKYNDLKPRVYFAQGGSTFASSKYIREIFNSIADSLDVVHSKNRFFLPEGELTKEDSVIIYDYSSFTSTIQEVTRFVGELSKFYRGVTVFLVEGKGLITRDLGELLAEYNQDCNLYAEFDLGAVASFLDEQPLVLGHTCGMLGVPGNIAAATILHGIHTCFISQSHNRSRCVGDDALLYLPLPDPLSTHILQMQLQNIGRISIEKTEIFPYEEEDDYDLRAWQYIKRPILRMYNRIISFWMATFPTLDCLIGLSDPNRTQIPGANLIHNRRQKFYNIWMRLLFRLWVEGGSLEEDERDFLSNFQLRSFKDLGILGKRVGKHSEGSTDFFVPLFLQHEEFGQDPLQYVAVQFLYEEEVVVPMSCRHKSFPLGYLGEEFRSNPSKLLSYLDNMGVLKKEMEFESISRRLLGDLDFAKRMITPESILYKYTVIRPIPAWMYSQMPNT